MNKLITLIKNTNKSLLIAPSSYHVPVMLQLNKEVGLLDVKYLSRENFISSNSFVLKEEALVIICKTLELPPTVVSEVIDYLPYVHNHTKEGLELFARVEQVIIDKKLIQKGIPFEQLYLNRTIYIYGYPALDKLFLRYLDTLKDQFTIKIVPFETQTQSIPFKMFHSEYEEVEYLCNTISEKISKEFDVSRIKVHITSPSYHPIISTLFNRFNLSPYFSQTSNLASLNCTNRILKMINASDKSIEETLQDIYPVLQKTLAYTSEESNALFIQYIGVLNKYILFDGLLKDYTTLIEYDLGMASVKNTKSVSSIFIGDLTAECIDEADIVYILGCNEGEIPRVTKNNKILDDSVLLSINAESSIEQTVLSKTEYISLIESNTVEYVSYSTHSLTSEKIISTLAAEMIEKDTFTEEDSKTFIHHYSLSHDLITLGKMISDTKEYGVVTEDLGIYVNSVLSNTSYPKKFQQKTGDIEPALIPQILKDITSLSYSSINDYFKCNFKFLLKKVLRVPETYGERLPAIIGNLYHKTLQRIKEVPTDVEKKDAFFTEVLNDLIEEKEYDLSKKELFYLTHSFGQLRLVTDWVNEIHNKTDYSPLYHEKEYIIELNGEFITEFKGIVDMIMTLDNDFFIVDYKTGAASINISNLEFGLESQLVFYLYLVAQGEKDLTSPSGFFYSPVYSKLMNAEKGKTYNDLLLESWKLDGYVSEEKLSKIDPEYAEGSFIKGVKTLKNKSSLRKGAKTLSTKQQNRLVQHIEKLLDQAVSDIESGKFDVNPKGSLAESQSCAYCEFKDICFKTESNFISKTSKDKNSLEFLKGGEDNDSN